MIQVLRRCRDALLTWGSVSPIEDVALRVLVLGSK